MMLIKATLGCIAPTDFSAACRCAECYTTRFSHVIITLPRYCPGSMGGRVNIDDIMPRTRGDIAPLTRDPRVRIDEYSPQDTVLTMAHEGRWVDALDDAVLW